MPFQFRRDILARLIDIYAEEMKKNKTLRTSVTDPRPYSRQPVLSRETPADTHVYKRARIILESTDSGSGLEREHISFE